VNKIGNDKNRAMCIGICFALLIKDAHHVDSSHTVTISYLNSVTIAQPQKSRFRVG